MIRWIVRPLGTMLAVSACAVEEGCCSFGRVDDDMPDRRHAEAGPSPRSVRARFGRGERPSATGVPRQKS
jgi:hypothetical protein